LTFHPCCSNGRFLLAQRVRWQHQRPPTHRRLLLSQPPFESRRGQSKRPRPRYADRESESRQTSC
jgi:hypothetical protein